MRNFGSGFDSEPVQVPGVDFPFSMILLTSRTAQNYIYSLAVDFSLHHEDIKKSLSRFLSISETLAIFLVMLLNWVLQVSQPFSLRRQTVQTICKPCPLFQFSSLG